MSIPRQPNVFISSNSIPKNMVTNNTSATTKAKITKQVKECAKRARQTSVKRRKVLASIGPDVDAALDELDDGQTGEQGQGGGNQHSDHYHVSSTQELSSGIAITILVEPVLTQGIQKAVTSQNPESLYKKLVDAYEDDPERLKNALIKSLRLQQEILDVALGKSHEDMVHFLIENGEMTPEQQQTILMKAIDCPSFSVTEGLTMDPALLTKSIDDKGNTLLHRAIQKNNEPVFHYLVDAVPESPQLNTTNGQGWTPLQEAVDKGLLAFVKRLVEEGAEVDPGCIAGQDTNTAVATYLRTANMDEAASQVPYILTLREALLEEI